MPTPGIDKDEKTRDRDLDIIVSRNSNEKTRPCGRVLVSAILSAY